MGGGVDAPDAGIASNGLSGSVHTNASHFHTFLIQNRSVSDGSIAQAHFILSREFQWKSSLW